MQKPFISIHGKPISKEELASLKQFGMFTVANGHVMTYLGELPDQWFHRLDQKLICVWAPIAPEEEHFQFVLVDPNDIAPGSVQNDVIGLSFMHYIADNSIDFCDQMLRKNEPAWDFDKDMGIVKYIREMATEAKKKTLTILETPMTQERWMSLKKRQIIAKPYRDESGKIIGSNDLIIDNPTKAWVSAITNTGEKVIVNNCLELADFVLIRR